MHPTVLPWWCILPVEDQADLRASMGEVFTGLRMEVQSAADVNTALELLKQRAAWVA